MSDGKKSEREAKTRVDRGEASASRVGNERPPSELPACLVVIYGPELGRRARLGEGTFEIGRSSRADLTIDQESVSRTHARILWNGQEHAVEDVQSTNGVFVNDMRVLRVPLENGDQIKVGRSILKYIRGRDLEQSYHEEIYRLMTTDALTGAFNRRYFMEATGREVKRAARYGRPLAVISFDIDRMGAINDRYGQVAGDSVIRELAQALLPRTREQDVMARLGGQEFAILLPEVDAEAAAMVADKIRQLAESAKFTVEDESFACSVSIGVVGLDREEESADMLVGRAANAVKRAKRNGRNRVEMG